VEPVADRGLRADAVRNAERIVVAARRVYAATGPDASTEDIARAAGVGERTLYRRFPTKVDLLKAVLERVATDLSPAIDKARADDDPLRGLSELLEAAISLAAQDHNLLAAARRAGPLSDDFPAPLYEALGELTVRAQVAGLVSAEVAPEDLPRIIAMLHSVLPTMQPSSDGWRRYVVMILNSISTIEPRSLPGPAPVVFSPRPDTWPR
jgi:AcrR family transcriptional regulator